MPTVELLIKSPSSASAPETPLRLTVPIEGTVRDIKQALTDAHPEHPQVHEQRLIFAGRLLQDSAPTSEVLRQVWRLSTQRHTLAPRTTRADALHPFLPLP